MRNYCDSGAEGILRKLIGKTAKLVCKNLHFIKFEVFKMKKISLKATIAAVSLSLALIPVGFAQSPSATSTNTQPLPGAKIASQVELVAAGGGLTTAGMVAVAAALVAVGAITIAQAESKKDDEQALLQALAAANLTVSNNTVTR